METCDHLPRRLPHDISLTLSLDLMESTILLQVQVIVAAAMTGIIWLVQLVVYPQFLNVRPADFSRYHQHHSFGIGCIVAPLMIVELILSGWSVWQLDQHGLRLPLAVAASITLLLWLSTFLVQVPLHRQLEGGWSEPHIRILIRTNWIRTILWTGRLALLIYVTGCE